MAASTPRAERPASDPLSEEMQARLRYLQIEAVLHQTPLAMVANLACLVAVCTLFWQHPDGWLLPYWGALVVVAVVAGLRGWWRFRRAAAAGRPRRASARTIRRATLHATLLALIWALPPMLLAHDASWEQRLILVAISAGMMCSGGFALCTIARAGTVFPLVIGLGCALAVLRAELSLAVALSLLLLMYVAIVARSVRGASRTFTARFMAEVQAEQQSQVIGLLLREFEAHSADLLWEADAAGRLRRVSPRLAEALGPSADALEGQPLAALLAQRQQDLDPTLRSDGEAALAKLTDAFGTAKPFRDLELPLRLAGPGEHAAWWSLTAKPLDGDGGWRGVAVNVTAARQARRDIWQLAHFDLVTGLANRHHFRAELDATLASIGATGGGRCAVLLVDLDHFKHINDALGHDVGDKVLKVVGQRFAHVKRGRDLVARLGGDEFALIVREIEGDGDAMNVAERLLRALRRPCDIDGVSVSVGASIGIAVAPADSAEADTLLKHADLALYAAKEERPSQIRFYAASMATRMLQRVAMERHLRDAIAQQQLRLVFQPQLHIASGEVAGFEALVRWRHPELGEVSPAQFIPVAEESGLILDIGTWVLREACRQAAAWPDGLTVAVNLSVRQILSQDLRTEVVHALAASGLPAARLHVEVTESVLLKEGDAPLAKLRSLHAMGIRIALDDFGTGYSAMAYLRRFPFDVLKIDRAFVQELAHRADGRAIVRAIIEMAHALEMETIAEGVEQAAELDVLRGQGCDGAQGYLISRPLAAEDVAGFIAGRAGALNAT